MGAYNPARVALTPPGRVSHVQRRERLAQLGVYRGAAADIAPIVAYEKFLGLPAGRTVDYVLAFMADSPASWRQFETAALQAVTNGEPGQYTAADWVPQLGPRKLMLAVPACCMGTSWAQEAAGANDAHWAQLARNLAVAGLGSCVLRIGREFNGSWYRWKVTPASAPGYQAAYPRIVSVMRTAGFTGQFMWNPIVGQGSFGPASGVENVYPGDGVVDIIGLDLYDGGYSPAGEIIRTTTQQRAVWNGFRDQWDGLTGWRQLAFSHGKPLAYPEWGLQLWNTGALYSGGGDNALFIREMAAWMQDTATWMHALWEDPGMGVADPDDHPRRLVAVPQARAAFLAAFGTPET